MKRKYLILLSLTGTIVALDQLTKHLVTQRFFLGESVAIIRGFFNLTYIRNTGAAFGLLSQAHPEFRIPFFIIVPIIALGVILSIFRRVEDNDVLMSSALSLIVGGAFGNLIDRAAYNYVIDFLDFHWNYRIHFPAFNVADMGITVGVAYLMFDLLKKEKNASNPS